MTYSEKLKDPRWQKKRLEILDHGDWTCCGCNSKDKELHVHHKTYEFGKSPWDYDFYNFQVLCKDCHEREENYKAEFRDLVNHLLVNYDLNYETLVKALMEKFPD